MASNMTQLDLPKVEVAKTVNGLEMGVLSDGTSYLNHKSLARICGAASSTITNQAQKWADGARDNRLSQMLEEAGVPAGSLFVQTADGGKRINAYPDHVCMVFLEYYAFETRTPDPQAQQNYRLLARAGLRAFVYNALGYAPSGVPQEWRQFHDRVSLVSAPAGYFSIFQEISSFVVAAIRGGLKVDAKTIPDISVGQTWANHWRDNDLDNTHGKRVKFDHNYPDYFPQAESNPQPMWVYPVAALPEFRVWLQGVYVPEKLPNYLNTKVSKGALPASAAELLLAEVAAPELPEHTS